MTGFTAGNQPIAQAAMIDGSTDEADRDRNMGYILTGISAGLVAGPIIGGVLSDPAVLGNAASLTLPLWTRSDHPRQTRSMTLKALREIGSQFASGTRPA